MENELRKLSQQDKLSKFCVVAGFLNVVEIGQYFMTKDTAELSQMLWLVVSTLCQEIQEHRSQKVGSEGTPKIGPVIGSCKLVARPMWS